MADLESTLSGILSDPEAVRKLQDLGKSLGLTGDNSKESTQVPEPASASVPDLSSISALSSLLGTNSSQNTDSTDIMKKFTSFLPLINKMQSDDESTALLAALRPFLSDHKRRRLDDASKMLRVMRILPFIRSAGLF